MVSAAHPAPDAPHGVEVTAESLQEELARLEIQKQALERELSAVVAHLGSVQRVLGTLRAVLPSQTEVPAPAARPAPAAEPSPQAADDAAAGDDGQRTYGRLTGQILEFFAGTGGADVRARDVAAALGRDTGNGSINAVRSTLDRLVATSRIRRTGRGLYRAV